MSLTNVEFTPKELNSIVLKNLLIMFERRNYISDHEKTFSTITNPVITNTVLKVKGDYDKDSEKLIP